MLAAVYGHSEGVTSLNGLTSLQMEKRTHSPRGGSQMTKFSASELRRYVADREMTYNAEVPRGSVLGTTDNRSRRRIAVELERSRQLSGPFDESEAWRFSSREYSAPPFDERSARMSI